MINNYEEEIVHDILYHARGKGYITELEIVDLAYPMIMGFKERNETDCGKGYITELEIVDLAYPMIMGFKERNETDCSELNFLQSYQIFDSLKRLVFLNKLQVKSDGMSSLLSFMYLASQIKSGEITLSDVSGGKGYSRFFNDYANYLQELYGLTDGIVKPRSHFGNRRIVYDLECTLLSEVYVNSF